MYLQSIKTDTYKKVPYPKINYIIGGITHGDSKYVPSEFTHVSNKKRKF